MILGYLLLALCLAAVSLFLLRKANARKVAAQERYAVQEAENRKSADAAAMADGTATAVKSDPVLVYHLGSWVSPADEEMHARCSGLDGIEPLPHISTCVPQLTARVSPPLPSDMDIMDGRREGSRARIASMDLLDL